MKKSATLLLGLMIVVFAASAQDLKLKGGFSFATESEVFGIQVGAKYPITSEIDLAGGLTFYFPDKTTFNNPFGGGTTTIKTGLWMLDVDGHYNFESGALTFYPLAGLNLSNFTVSVDGNGDTSSYVGLNVGGGMTFGITDALDGFAEIKYIIGEADQAVIGLGVQFGL